MFRLTSSSLYDQSTFYDRFYKDLRSARRRVVIESPFITQRRSTPLLTTISKLKKRRVEVIVNTKPIEEHDSQYQDQVAAVVEMMQDLGVRVLFTNGHHLYESFHECLIAFPKSERYSLGATCQSEILELLRLSLRAAGSTKPSDKAAYIKEASVRLDSLRLLLNLCKDCKCVSNQTYQQLDSTCNEIGRMLGGWLKSITSSP